MPFEDMSKMDARRRMVNRVMEGLSITAAAREAGVSRPTARLWLQRAQEDGLGTMQELSRRPTHSPKATADEVVSQVMKFASERPRWGPAILFHLLWPNETKAPICERTFARILARHGRRVLPASQEKAEPVRFERSSPNELWQTDHKKLGGRRNRAEALSVIDDAARFCLDLRHVPNQTLDQGVWNVLWPVFADFGLPLAMLSDNGPAFRNNATWRWSSFDLRLMLLGIKPIHGRPYHPQTQGKVERFHLTIERELQLEPKTDVQRQLDSFRNDYNWIRPHQALNMRTPGSVYKTSERKRPGKMPDPFFPEGAIIRKCSDPGVFHFKGSRYKAGRAFTNLPVGLLEREDGGYNLAWATFTLGPIEELKV
jgi:transposase InsO family protein